MSRSAAKAKHSTTASEAKPEVKKGSAGNTGKSSSTNPSRAALNPTSGNSRTKKVYNTTASSAHHTDKVHTVATHPSTAPTTKQSHFSIRFNIEKVPDVDPSKLAKQRGAWYKTLFENGSGLSTVYMTDESSDSKMGSPNIVNFNIYGSLFRLWVPVCFGEDERTENCRLLLDSGSSLTWINERTYTQMCMKNSVDKGKKLGRQVTIRYGDMPQEITGELYESTLSLDSGRAAIEKQTFAVVSEADQPYVRYIRENDKIQGVLGFGPSEGTKGHVVNEPNGVIVSVLDNMLGMMGQKACKLEVNIVMPAESSGGKTQWPQCGNIHISGYDIGSTSQSGEAWIPANKLGDKVIFALDMKLKYEQDEFTKPYWALIDFGAPFIHVPKEILEAYIKAAENSSDGKIKFEYDKTVNAYYLMKEQVMELKPLGFKFRGKEVVFPANAQVIPASMFKDWDSHATDGRFYTVFQPRGPLSHPKLILLGEVWISRFDLKMRMDNSGRKEVLVTEMKGKTDYVWEELRS